ncbi:MAG: peptidase Ste24p [Ferruginibacter sp.]|nr:peptidase Ste24p [Ferruginibacter sp.]
MRKNKTPWWAFGILLTITFTASAQDPYSYFSPLSKTAYAAKITELKARKIPTVYQDKKEQQSYAGIIKERNDAILEDFENNRVIADSLLLNKSKAIIQRIKASNSSYNFDSISIYINRSAVPNASCYGEGTLFINLGLFLWVDNDDELALIVAHELSHQFLAHQESKIKKNIALLSSEEFTSEMKAIKKSSTGKYERFKKLMKEMVTQNGTHSRYKESEADSLGVVLI